MDLIMILILVGSLSAVSALALWCYKQVTRED